MASDLSAFPLPICVAILTNESDLLDFIWMRYGDAISPVLAITHLKLFTWAELGQMFAASYRCRKTNGLKLRFRKWRSLIYFTDDNNVRRASFNSIQWIQVTFQNCLQYVSFVHIVHMGCCNTLISPWGLKKGLILSYLVLSFLVLFYLSLSYVVCILQWTLSTV